MTLLPLTLPWLVYSRGDCIHYLGPAIPRTVRIKVSRSMENTLSWQTDSRLAGYEILYLLWIPQFHMFTRVSYWTLSWTFLTYLLTPWCRILFEKLIVTQLVKKYPSFLRNPKVHHRVHKRPPLDPIPSQTNPVRPIDPYLPKVHLNVILPLCHEPLESIPHPQVPF
jgi:hypothetical protein